MTTEREPSASNTPGPAETGTPEQRFLLSRWPYRSWARALLGLAGFGVISVGLLLDDSPDSAPPWVPLLFSPLGWGALELEARRGFASIRGDHLFIAWSSNRALGSKDAGRSILPFSSITRVRRNAADVVVSFLDEAESPAAQPAAEDYRIKVVDPQGFLTALTAAVEGRGISLAGDGGASAWDGEPPPVTPRPRRLRTAAVRAALISAAILALGYSIWAAIGLLR